MKNKIFLSLIIPVHNSEKTIRPLLLSINNSQFNNFKDIEAVIIDDGSTDCTLRVIEKFLSGLKFNLKTIVQKKNVGPARARNLGVKNALGEYVLFLDSDVQLKKHSLQRVFDLFKKGKVKAFTGIWHYQQKTTKFFPQFKALRDWAYWFIERKKYARYYLFSTRVAGIEKKLFKKIGGFNENYPQPTVEDIELTYRIEKITPIKFSTNIVVAHEFENFWPIAVKYFKRSRDWVGLYMRRLRFDPVATSQTEAFKSIVATLIPFFILLAFYHNFFSYLLVSLLTIFTFLEFDFWKFLLKKKGTVFLLKAIPVSIILYFVINLGAAWGLFLYFIKNRKK